MIFSSGIFFFFFVVLYVFYKNIQNFKVQNLVLLVGSYLFYAYWDIRFLSLIVISTFVDYFCAKKIEKSFSLGLDKRARIFAVLSLVINFSLLGFFKYFHFLEDSFTFFLVQLGIESTKSGIEIILPLGISFYTFQTVSYTIDVYRKRFKPIDSYLDFSLYVSFFPQLVAGPIERARTLLTQIQKERVIERLKVQQGAWLVFFGLFKKIYIADNLESFDYWGLKHHGIVESADYWVASLSFLFEFLCDFSAYSDIAVGLGFFLGFNLTY